MRLLIPPFYISRLDEDLNFIFLLADISMQFQGQTSHLFLAVKNVMNILLAKAKLSVNGDEMNEDRVNAGYMIPASLVAKIEHYVTNLLQAEGGSSFIPSGQNASESCPACNGRVLFPPGSAMNPWTAVCERGHKWGKLEKRS